ncbi:MAG: phage tail protein [Caldilineaceae bacterium]|nr:phage tail protein [Caldilineaceae bacterium]
MAKPSVRPSDPLAGFTFQVQISGVNGGESIGYFTEASGVGNKNDVVTHKTVDAKGAEVVHVIPGRSDPGEITLKRGVTRDILFWEWRKQVVSGDTVGMRRYVTITVLDRSYTPAVVFQFENVWPSRISLGEISAESTNFIVEEVVLQHEGGSTIVQPVPVEETTSSEDPNATVSSSEGAGGGGGALA